MNDIHKELKEVVSSLKGHLIYQRDILLAEGLSADEYAKIRAAIRQESESRSQSKQSAVGSQQAAVSNPPIQQLTDSPQIPGKSHKELLEGLRSEIGVCQRCKLGKTRTNLVFGVGNPDAKIVFVGEGPGRDEDLQGEPFVGRAGQLLTDIITKGMKMMREDVYICNVVKCRPPENRNPEPDEIDACERFLIRQLEIIRPEIIVALGTFAAQTLLKTELPISKLRGRFHDYKGIQVMPTFHPSYLLRNPDKKKETWEDIKMVIARLG
ncbi:MAG: uracil-DNA glycosylase [Deltaproteobacteria bacterium]|nr:uracil-DNA glycosylase [Deltaproteobacteria bacterium]